MTQTECDWFGLLCCLEQSDKQNTGSCLDFCGPQPAVRRVSARWLELASARTCRTSEATPMDRLYIHVSDVEAGARVWPRVSSEGFECPRNPTYKNNFIFFCPSRDCVGADFC